MFLSLLIRIGSVWQVKRSGDQISPSGDPAVFLLVLLRAFPITTLWRRLLRNFMIRIRSQWGQMRKMSRWINFWCSTIWKALDRSRARNRIVGTGLQSSHFKAKS
eukprot:Lithocolla_globosa_v1_NODE_216_length_5076_cov_24.159729.p7 type:complete len:105 gc:universal NODE_216_length_5076_cov_24.159729:3195-2881(-)